MTYDDAAARVATIWKDLAPPEADPGVDDWRRAYDTFLAQFPLPDDLEVEEVDCGGVPALWVRAPGATTERTLLHFHSGGYVMGSAAGYRAFGYRLSEVTGAPVLIPDYRLAPEHPFPAPVEDAVTVYRWLAERVAPGSVVTVGDSAGGGLNLALLVALREAGAPLPAAAIAISPLTDLAAEGDSYETNRTRDPLVTRELTIENAATYLGEERDPKEVPLASPLYADLAGLPPLLLFAGSAEVMLDDSVRFAEKVRAAGGTAELIVDDDMLHIYPLFAELLPQGRAAIERIGAFVAEYTPA
ncbi:MAG: alpha/beta hydrolase [Actinobacteria bacterium]|nr:alpha/beta hydrolase [Actinomycetota bacterium]